MPSYVDQYVSRRWRREALVHLHLDGEFHVLHVHRFLLGMAREDSSIVQYVSYVAVRELQHLVDNTRLVFDNPHVLQN